MINPPQTKTDRLRNLPIGDMFYIPESTRYDWYTIARKAGISVTIRKTTEGTGLWRLK